MKKEDILTIQQNETKFKQFIEDYFEDEDFEGDLENLFGYDDFGITYIFRYKDADILYDLDNERIDVKFIIMLEDLSYSYDVKDVDDEGYDYEDEEEYFELDADPDAILHTYATPKEGGRQVQVDVIAHSDDLDSDLADNIACLIAEESGNFNNIDLETIIDEFIKTI